eukprot:m.27949 g.27949  ORF g.27949 m.27949 type:complete len:742 (-) comp7957_c0_seq1:31-2256(-)
MATSLSLLDPKDLVTFPLPAFEGEKCFDACEERMLNDEDEEDFDFVEEQDDHMEDAASSEQWSDESEGDGDDASKPGDEVYVRSLLSSLGGERGEPYAVAHRLGDDAIYTMDEFLTPAECDAILEAAKPVMTEIFDQKGKLVRRRGLVFETDNRLMRRLEARLDDDLLLQRINRRFVPPYGFHKKVKWNKNTAMLNPCLRISATSASSSQGLGWHRDAAYTEARYIKSNYSIIIYLSGDNEANGTQFMAPSKKVSHCGQTIEEELASMSEKERSKTLTINCKKGRAVIFHQKLLHQGLTIKPSKTEKYVLRTDLICTGSKSDEPISDAERVARAMFRTAQLQDLVGNYNMAGKLYERATSLRLGGGKYHIDVKKMDKVLNACAEKYDENDKGIAASHLRLPSGVGFESRDGRKYTFVVGSIRKGYCRQEQLRVAAVFVVVTECARIQNSLKVGEKKEEEDDDENENDEEEEDNIFAMLNNVYKFMGLPTLPEDQKGAIKEEILAPVREIERFKIPEKVKNVEVRGDFSEEGLQVIQDYVYDNAPTLGRFHNSMEKILDVDLENVTLKPGGSQKRFLKHDHDDYSGDEIKSNTKQRKITHLNLHTNMEKSGSPFGASIGYEHLRWKTQSCLGCGLSSTGMIPEEQSAQVLSGPVKLRVDPFRVAIKPETMQSGISKGVMRVTLPSEKKAFHHASCNCEGGLVGNPKMSKKFLPAVTSEMEYQIITKDGVEKLEIFYTPSIVM